MNTTINQRLFTTRAPIAELVAAAIARETALKVRLYTLLIWVRKNVQRIVSRAAIRELAKTAERSIINTVPIPAITPAAKVGKQDTFKALAEKGKTAAAKTPRGFGGKAMKSLNKSHSRGAELNSVYRDSLRETVAEAGI
jgi:hypothetical protein